MSKRAEKAALKAYPECAVYNDLAMEYEDINGCYRVGFETGYEQAEKDLALTWEDASTIVTIAMDIIGEGKIVGEQNIYTEVLRRFNEQREKK